MSSLAKFELLKKEFLNSLSKEKYDLLKTLSEYSKCISDFIFRHTEELNYIYSELDTNLYGRERLVNEALKLLDNLSDNQFVQELTKFKMRHFSRIVAKDIYSKEKFENLTEEYSYLADATLEVAYKKAFEKNKKIYGTPIESSTGKEATGLIIALGKYGGLDLNYYSDIDVMYIYSEEGKTDKGFTNREFFGNVFRTLTNYLTKRNIEGITWIVDLDLRPEGKKGFIAHPLTALEYYYWTFGRTWERHMLIKARYGAGNSKLFSDFEEIIIPFVYRKHTSSEIFEEITELKKLVEQEANKKIENGFDVKRGKGGIREVEFTVQILQLLYGGKDKDLRERKTLNALRKLVLKGLLDSKDGKILEEGYFFLRKLEHIIQIENCIQTHTLKFNETEKIAKKLGFEDKDIFLQKLNYYRNNINKIFSNVIPETDIKLTPIQKFILTKHFEDEAKEYLKSLGFKSPDWALDRFKDIFLSKTYIELSAQFKENLFEFIPELEKQLKDFEDREDFLLNLTKLLIDGGMLIIFSSALEQNKNLVNFMLNIAKLSDYISSLMSKDRELLDWVFGIEDTPEDKRDFEREFNNFLKRYDYIDSLKKLKKYVEVSNSISYLSKIDKENSEERLKSLNKSLTNLAEYIIEKLYRYYEGKDLAIYGLGKIGSKEMNIGSDLDLIFIMKDEKSKIQFNKIPVNITKALTSYTKEGILYQIDLRLRPFGRKGELASTVNFYKNYFEREAKAWERLAWTKGRFLVGDREIKEKMENLINEFLFNKPINKDFIENILEMRFKLEGMARETNNEIDIKLGKGGLTDIEFLSQLKIILEKTRETNILKIVKEFYPFLLDEYLFLREVEARLRMIKGVGLSKISLNSPFLYRIAHSFNRSENKLWEDILSAKDKIRKIFLKKMKIN